jgi:hypothetical protein
MFLILGHQILVWDPDSAKPGSGSGFTAFIDSKYRHIQLVVAVEYYLNVLISYHVSALVRIAVLDSDSAHVLCRWQETIF